jgi:peptidoglycan-N-acetylglucosamine deacetylase
MNRIALSIDIEDWYHTPLVTGSSFSKFESVESFFDSWEDRYDFLSEPLRRLLGILSEYDATATFFVVADIIDNYPGLIEEIVQHGHEIACHGLHHEMVVDEHGDPRITLSEFRDIIIDAKKRLETVAGTSVTGYRAPSAYIRGWMLDVLEDIGFTYDSSVAVNSIYSKIGERPDRVTTIPYYPIPDGLGKGDSPREIIEMPWPYWSLLGFKFPTGGGPFLRYGGGRYISLGLDQSLKRGDTVFYFHPLDIAEEKFPIDTASKRPFYWYGKGKRTEKSIRHILKRYSGRKILTTCEEIRNSWE